MGTSFSKENENEKSKSLKVITPLSAKEESNAHLLFDSWVKESTGATISRDVLGKHIPSVVLVDCLVHQGIVASWESFFTFLEASCKPSSPRALLETLFQIATKQSANSNTTALNIFLTMIFDTAIPSPSGVQAADIESKLNESSIHAIERFVLSKTGVSTSEFDLTALYLFVTEYAPHVTNAFSLYCRRIFLTNTNTQNTAPSFIPPVLTNASSIVQERDLAYLALYSSLLQGPMARLYSSSFDGYSFQHILQSILGYGGPTLILIKVRPPKVALAEHANQVIFGCLAHAPWKEDRKFFGSSQSFLFTLSPELKLFRAQGGELNYQWLNTKASNPKTHGLALGGDSDFRSSRIFIPSSLEGCVATPTCSTYQVGTLVPPWAQKTGGLPGEFDIDVLEIWAVGGEAIICSAMVDRDKARGLAADTLQKARKCDKAAFFGSAFDQEMLLGKTMAHKKDMEMRD